MKKNNITKDIVKRMEDIEHYYYLKMIELDEQIADSKNCEKKLTKMKQLYLMLIIIVAIIIIKFK